MSLGLRASFLGKWWEGRLKLSPQAGNPEAASHRCQHRSEPACGQTGGPKVCLPALCRSTALCSVQCTHRSNLASFQNWELSGRISNQGRSFLLFWSSHNTFIYTPFKGKVSELRLTSHWGQCWRRPFCFPSPWNAAMLGHLACSVLVREPRAPCMLCKALYH